MSRCCHTAGTTGQPAAGETATPEQHPPGPGRTGGGGGISVKAQCAGRSGKKGVGTPPQAGDWGSKWQGMAGEGLYVVA
jgi:hypothetical protein